MTNIPKKVTERFIKSILKFQKVLQIAKDHDVNESDTVSILNDILGEVFGYEKYLEVTSEFAIRSTFCDLVLKVDGKVQFILEAKAVGITLKETHMKQACDYGANHGVQWIILTNGIEWRIYRIRFEQPINYDLVCAFDFSTINPRDEKCQEILFLLSKEGLAKNLREEYYEKVQSVNRYVIGQLILADPVIDVIRRELKKLTEGMRIEEDEIEQIVRAEVLKREIVEGEQSEAAKARINKFYRKMSSPRRCKSEEPTTEAPQAAANESVTERLLREAKLTETLSTDPVGDSSKGDKGEAAVPQ